MQHLPEVSGKWQPMGHVWPLLAVAGLGFVVAIAAWISVPVWEERLAKAKFNDVAGDYATVLQSGLNEYLDKIRALVPSTTPRPQSIVMSSRCSPARS
jgi:hypothetical protein